MSDQPPGLETWKEHVEPIERVRSVAEALQRSRGAEWIADEAGVEHGDAREHLDRLATEGVLCETDEDRFGPNPPYTHTEIVRAWMDTYDLEGSHEVHSVGLQEVKGNIQSTIERKGRQWPSITRQLEYLDHAIEWYDAHKRGETIPTPPISEEEPYDQLTATDRALHVSHRELDRHPIIERARREVAKDPFIAGWVDESAASIPSDGMVRVSVHWTAGKTPGDGPKFRLDHTKPKLRWGAPGFFSRQYLRTPGSTAHIEDYEFPSISPARVVWQVLNDLIAFYREYYQDG